MRLLDRNIRVNPVVFIAARNATSDVNVL